MASRVLCLRKILLGFPFSLITLLLLGKSVQGQYQYQNHSVPLPSIVPLDTQLLTQIEAGEILPDHLGTAITENTINQRGLTLPSLWWASQQHGEDLLVTWLAYPGDNRQIPGRVDLVVNRQAWREICYFDRYEFISKMGAIARDYGYNTRIFNRQGDTLATYTCNFGTPNLCNIQGLVITKGVSQSCLINN